MRTCPFPLAPVLALGIACSSLAAQKPGPAHANRNQPKKVWTNDDIGDLRARGLISIIGQEPKEAAQQAPPAVEPAQQAFPVYESRLDDPVWYADRTADLKAQLDARMADLQQLQEALALAKDRVMQPGIAMDKPSLALTPAAALPMLQARLQEIQSQLDDLADLARQHDIPPGAPRG
jgi:hypothetical protein